jgi:hypothetical protein
MVALSVALTVASMAALMVVMLDLLWKYLDKKR